MEREDKKPPINLYCCDMCQESVKQVWLMERKWICNDCKNKKDKLENKT